MESSNNDGRDVRRKTRPAQRLYVPPAQRNKNKAGRSSSQTNMNISDMEVNESDMNPNGSDVCQEIQSVKPSNSEESKESNSTNNDEQSLVIMLDNLKMGDNNEKNVDNDKEEMERAIVNINRKTRPLIKHVNVGNKDVLRIAIDDKDLKEKTKPKSNVKGAISHKQVSNWEDLFNEDDEINGGNKEQIKGNKVSEDSKEESSDEEELPKKNAGPNDLDHVIELYDFPSSFRTQDLMQLYSDVNNELMYIKWCDETHALLVLSTPNQAKRALHIQHGIIKSRAMGDASNIAAQVASRVDLKPAMKRPQTNMQTARRLINNHLGTKSKLSKEECAKEREELRKAKELKKALKQSENDAWNGNPRPSTA
ncbi:putative R3H domain and coiled-coil containing [Trypoxylus dichotomus]